MTKAYSSKYILMEKFRLKTYGNISTLGAWHQLWTDCQIAQTKLSHLESSTTSTKFNRCNVAVLLTLADVCTPVLSVVGRWQLWSANSGKLVVLGTRTTIGQGNFAMSGPVIWNRLPVELRTSSLSTDTFAKNLKSFVYLRAPLMTFVY